MSPARCSSRRIARSTACSSTSIRAIPAMPRPPRPGRRSRPRPLSAAGRGAGDAARARGRGRPRDPHVRPRSPSVHARRVDEQGARGSRLPPFRAGLAARQPPFVGTDPFGGARRLRSARAARPRGGADAPIDWAKTRAYTSVVSTGEGVSNNCRPGAPRNVAQADFGRVRDEVAQALLEFEDPETGGKPIGAVFRKEEVLAGPYLDRAPDLLLEPAPL